MTTRSILQFSAVLLFLYYATITASAVESRPVYNVRDFGAIGDGMTKDTVAFQKALDTCAVNGGGDVHVPVASAVI